MYTLGMALLGILYLLFGSCRQVTTIPVCNGQCTSGDTILYVDSRIKSVYVGNPYYLADLTYIPSSCKTIYDATLTHHVDTLSFDSLFSAATINVAKSKSFWDTFGLGIETALFLFSIVFAVVSVKRVLLNTRSDFE